MSTSLQSLGKLSHAEEVDWLLSMGGGKDEAQGFSTACEKLEKQLAVIQTRSQLLLTLGTITLTITGFSGPKIAESGIMAQIGMAGGLIFVLAAMVTLIFGSLQIQWVTQYRADSIKETLLALLAYRDQKTVAYHWEVALLAIGLMFYVGGMVAYVLVQSR